MRSIFIIALFLVIASLQGQDIVNLNVDSTFTAKAIRDLNSANGSVLGYEASVVQPIRIFSTVQRDGDKVYWLDEVVNDTALFNRYPIGDLSNDAGFASLIEDIWTPRDSSFTLVFVIRRKTSVNTRFSFTGSDINNQNYLRTTNPQMQVQADGSFVINQIPTGINNDTTYKVIGFSYDTTDNRWRGFWDSWKYTSVLVEELNPVPDAHNFSAIVNNTDLQLISLFIYNRRLTDAELDTIRVAKKFPSGKLDFGMMLVNQDDNVNYTNQDIATGNSLEFLDDQLSNQVPPNLYDTTTNEVWGAYPLLVGYRKSGALIVPNYPDSTYNDSTLVNQVVHSSNGNNNRYQCYIDMNPNDSSLLLAAYELWDKSNRTFWKSSIENEHYIQNDNAQYVMWHNYYEANWEYIQEHCIGEACDRIQFDYTTQGDSVVTHYEKMYVYDTVAPVRDTLDQSTAYLVLFAGDGFMNGIHTAFTDFAYIYDYDKYLPTGNNDTIKRYDGSKMVSSGTPSDPGGDSYRFIPLNRLWNYRGAVAVGDQSTGNETMCMKDMLDFGDYADGKLFAHCFTVTGSYLIDNNTTFHFDTMNWSSNKTKNQLESCIKEFKFGIKELQSIGYKVKVLGINFACGVNHNTEYTRSQYQSELRGILNTFWEEFKPYNEDSIPIIGLRLDTIWYNSIPTESADSFNIAIENIASASSYFDYFDYEGYPISSTIYDMRTVTQRTHGKYAASAIRVIDQGYTKPSVSSVDISGTLEVGQYITASYTYSSSTSEGDTEIIIETADNTNGANKVYWKIINPGETWQLHPSTANKYARVTVTPVDNNGIMGRQQFSTWQLVSP